MASGRAHLAHARGDHGECTDGVGQEGHADADGLHDEDQVFRSDGDQSRGATPTRPSPVDSPTAIPRGAAGPYHILYRSREWVTRAQCWQELGPNVPQLLSRGERG